MSHGGGGQHQANIAGSVFLLCSTTLGAGILAMPSVFAIVGVTLGAISLTFFGIVTAYSIWLLLLAGEASGIKHSYEELLEYAFPKVGRIMTSIFIQLGLIGALTAFLVIIGDVLSSTVKLLTHGDEAFYTSRIFMVILFVICVIFPLSVLRDISLLEYTAFASVFIIFCFVVILTVLGGRAVNWNLAHWDEIKTFDLTVNTIFSALPTVSLAYTCQTSVFPIWKELQNPTKARMNLVQFIGSSVACVFYVIAGVFGYIYAPVNTPGNYLGVLPKSTFYEIFRLFFGIAIVFHFPVVHFAFRNSIIAILFPNRDFSWVRHIIVTIVIMIVTTTISLVIPDLGKVFELTGALAAYPIDFLLPALAYSKIVLWDNAGDRPPPKRYGESIDESIHEVLLSRSMDEDGERGVPASKKIGRLCTWRFVLPFIMIFGSIASSCISLFVIITTTDWSTVFTPKTD